MGNNMGKRIWLALLSLATVLTVPNISSAGGLFLSEFGTEDVALAGAGWAARAQDASTLYKNPAGMSLLEGNQFQGGLQLLYAPAKFEGTNTPWGGNDGGQAVGIVPGGSLSYVHSLGKDFKVGLGAIPNFGLGLHYDNNFLGRYYVQETTLVGITFAPVASYRVNEKLSVGGGPNVMLAKLMYTANVNNLLPPGIGDGKVQVEDTTAGVGGQVGVLFEPKKGSRIGVTYYSPMKLNFSDTPAFSNLGFIGNALQNNGLLNRRLDLGFTVPQRVILSGYHELTDRFAIMGNFGWDNWSQFGEVEVSVNTQNPRSLTTVSNYNDTYHAAIGGQYRLNPEWLFNGGFAFDSTMVSAANRQLALPVGATYKFGLGTQWLASPTVRLGFSYEFSYMGDLSVAQNRGPLAGQVNGQFNSAMMHFFAFTVNWGSKGVIFGPGGGQSPS